MSVSDIFSKFKGRPLDEKDIAWLRSSFELQHQANEQLTSANEALKENIQLKSERIATLERTNESLLTENANLKAEVELLQEQVDARKPLPTYEPSLVARAFLEIFRQADRYELWESEFQPIFENRIIELESAIHDLTANHLIRMTTVARSRGRKYELTQRGRQFILAMPEFKED